MDHYENDWATEAIIRQYFTNKHKIAYQHGSLTVSERYEYLKDNAAKRDPTASWKQKSAEMLEEHKWKQHCKAKKNKQPVEFKDIDEEGDQGQPEFVDGSSKDSNSMEEDEEEE